MANGLASLIAQPQVANIGQRFAQGQTINQRNLLFGQQQEELQRQQQARGLAGQALGGLQGIDPGLAAADPQLALNVFKIAGVVGERNQALFSQNVAQINALVQAGSIDTAIQFGEQFAAQVESEGGDATNTRDFIGQLRSGDPNAARDIAAIDSVLNPVAPSFKGRELGIKEETLQVRREENEQRRLDREASLQLRKDQAEIKKLDADLKRETNTLKQQELKTQSDQKKRDIQFQASNALDGVQSSIDTIDRLTAGEGLESAAGISSIFPTLPGTEAANFESDLESLKSQAFLTQVEKMKGLGTLTENEGAKLVAAIGALDLSQSDIVLRSSLNRIRPTMIKAKNKLKKKFNIEAGLQQPPSAQLGIQDLTADDLRNLSDEQLHALIAGGQ